MKWFYLTIFLLLSTSFAVCTQGPYNITKSAQNAGLPEPPQSGHYCCLTNCTSYYCPNQQLCSQASFCEQNNFYYWESFSGGYYYTQCDGCLNQQSSAVCNNGASLNYSGGITLRCGYRCSSQDEALQKDCELSGGIWEVNPTTGQNECKSNQCDSTFHCISYPSFRCVDVPASGQITCYNGSCSGLPYAMWWSEYREECSNDCGQTTERVIQGDTAVTFGMSCDEDQEKCGETKYCTEIGQNYIVYQKCLVGREVVGNVDTRQEIPYIVSSGKGTCRENGYSSSKYEHSNGGTNQNGPIQESNDCLLYGVGCPEDSRDTINYENQQNQTSQNGCYCRPFDGLNTLSQIICPDGTSTVVYMSCAEWDGRYSSSSGGGGVSSSTPAPQTSTSNPPSSDSFGEYPKYPTDQPTTNSNVQGALSGLSEYVIQIKNTLVSIKDYLFSDDVSITTDTMPIYPHGDYSADSSLEFQGVIDSIFSLLDSNKTIIDTSKKVSSGVCPIFTCDFSKVNQFLPFRGNSDVNISIDTSNLSGFNLCAIIKAVVLGMASIVSFFVGFSIFGKFTL